MREPYDTMKLDSRGAAGMWPVVRPGDELTYATQPKALRVGDLVVVPEGVQRLVWIDPFEMIWTCADGLGQAPVRRHKSAIKGLAIAVLRDGERIELQAKRPSLAVYVELGLSVIARRMNRNTPA